MGPCHSSSHAGAIMPLLASGLLLGFTPCFAGHETWSYDSYVSPGNKTSLGAGDIVWVYRHLHTPLTSSLPLLVLIATLGHVVSYGSNHVEFQLHDLNTGGLLRKTIKLSLSIARLSKSQQLRKKLSLYPRSSSPPPSGTHTAPVLDRGLRLSHHIGDRVLRDSDDLPVWGENRRVLNPQYHCFFFTEQQTRFAHLCLVRSPLTVVSGFTGLCLISLPPFP